MRPADLFPKIREIDFFFLRRVQRSLVSSMNLDKQFWPGKGWLLPVVVLFFAVSGFAEPSSLSSTNRFQQRAEKAFLEARTRFQQDATNTEAGVQFIRTSFDWAEFAVDKAQRE